MNPHQLHQFSPLSSSSGVAHASAENDLFKEMSSILPIQKRSWVFPVSAASPLHLSAFSVNPQEPPKAAPARIFITAFDRNTKKWRDADVIYVGIGGEQKLVFGRVITPGWYLILPVEGKYTIHVENLRAERISCRIEVDGESNYKFLGLNPLQKRMATFEIEKSVDDFEIEPSHQSFPAPRASVALASIKIKLRQVKQTSMGYRYHPNQGNQPFNAQSALGPADKKEALAYTIKTKQTAHSSKVKQVWKSGKVLAEISMQYRDEAWGIVSGLLPRRDNQQTALPDPDRSSEGSASKRRKLNDQPAGGAPVSNGIITIDLVD